MNKNSTPSVVNESQVIEEFCDAMFDHDIKVNPSDIVADGKLHRIHVDGDGPKELNGWYVLHIDDKPAGQFGCNRRHGYDVKFPWTSKTKRAPMTADERRAYREKMEADRQRRAAELAAKHKAAAELANRIWDAARPLDGNDHPYLARKGIESYGLRVGTWQKFDGATGEMQIVSKNALLVPIRDAAKNILSLQAIFPDSDNLIGRDKDYLSGADKHSRFYSFGKPVEVDGKMVILICEGYATGASLHQATGHGVIVAFDAPNLLPVAQVIRDRFPAATIIMCADNDQWTLTPVNNPGVTRANEARDAIGALVAIPPFDESLGIENEQGKKRGPTDFNDLAMSSGDEAVKAVIDRVLHADPVVEEPSAPVEVPPWEDAAADASQDDTPAFEPKSTPPDNDDDDGDDLPENNGYFTLLGYNRDRYYVFQHEKKQIQVLTKSDFSEAGLLELAPLQWWEMHFSGGDSGGIKKRAAANFIIRTCSARGIYDINRVRGRGAWIDEGRTVFHHGGYLSVDGVPMDLTKIKSRFVYELDISLPAPDDEALSDADGARIFGIAKRFRWTMPGSAALLAGFVMLAPLCGALRWRPHVWLTGGAGCGKSTVLNEFVHPLMNGMDLFAQGNSSEAGIRQTLKADARPVLFDESESNEENDVRRIQNVLSLIRQASTESEARTLKGTAGGESMSFHIRSMFCLASIQVAIKHQADVERLTVLALRPKREDNDAAGSWQALKEDLYAIKRDPMMAARLMRRALNLLPVIQENIDVFTRAAARKFGSQRDGDQYGTLLAGAWALLTSEPASEADAEEMIDGFDWSEHRENNESDEAERALSTLMEAPIQHQGTRYSVFELIHAAAEQADAINVPAKEANALLGRHGMRVRENVLLLSNTSEELRRLFANSPFAAGFRGVLLRLQGAGRNEHKPAKFSGVQSKCITLPLGPLLADNNTEDKF
ncbi:inner membrane protein [Caballeronia pedi]|uniref:Inner membrane protein n=1 Tax=Caballeronia pedi TaxID=1777141 RepID=A0A158DVE4_9BURK|nr:toprim domain-containing protein [Caballeronia pedi]SAK98503.1 inner membrane protein [Caballeronia pedi]